MGIIKFISNQCSKPTGFSGYLSTLFMNVLNNAMYNQCEKIILSDTGNKNILDIGFGNGYMLKRISNKNLNLSGIDISEDALVMANKKLGKLANLSHGDVEKLDFKESSIDLAYTINTFYFWQNPQNALSEIKKVLRNKGVFINFCYTKEWLDNIVYTKYGFNKLSKEKLLELHKNAGFSKVNIIEIIKGKSFFIYCKK